MMAFAKTKPCFLSQWHIQKMFDLWEEREGDLLLFALHSCAAGL